GTEWTPVRGENELIFGTNGISSGEVPYIKVQNNTAVAVNQGGKRKGSVAPYLEAWHPDFMAFCELKRESGDDRRRAHDVFPAAWVPDLLIERKED
ncbi:ribonucleoside-diphosphate reductase subunit alpha, partial [Acinetobacter baumannii]|nr:ribonucleoside-diphosphate reductase subunit alpha [Acinetobacter baumannii]